MRAALEPGCPWTAHGQDTLLPFPLSSYVCPPCIQYTHLLSDDPNGKALSVSSSLLHLPLSLGPQATCHHIRYLLPACLTRLHVVFPSMFSEPSLPCVLKMALASRLSLPCPSSHAMPVLSLFPCYRTVPTTVHPARPSQSLPVTHSHTCSHTHAHTPLSNSFPPWSVRPYMTIFFITLFTISHFQAPPALPSQAPWSDLVPPAARRPSDMSTPSLPPLSTSCAFQTLHQVLPLRAPDLAPSFAILPPCYSIPLRPAHLTVGHSTSC